MKELRLTEFQFRELVDTYDMQMDEMDFFLNIETGDVVILNTSYSYRDEGYLDMAEFTETVTDQRLQDRLL